MFRKLLQYGLITICGLSLLALLILFGWYQVDGQPLADADQYLQDSNFTSRQDAQGDWFFEPTKPNGYGVLILHGALIKPKSYSKSAAFFARQGYRVWLPSGDFRLSLLSSGRIAEQLASMPEKQWLLVGHSMGGMTSLTVLSELAALPQTDGSPVSIMALALWAGGVLEDFSDISQPLMFIRGENDAMMSSEKYASIQGFLPGHTSYHTMAGANHKNFALYSHQFFDGEGSISQHTQIDQANELSLQFFKAVVERR